MLQPTATPSPNQPTAKSQQPSHHQYGTRIRSNSVMRPSARLRQSTDSPAPPRRIKPVPVAKGKAASPSTEPPPVDMPVFPPPHVMLHSEDANNKVLLAIGRSFVSVDNKAMTIKDLAEMTIKYGLMCQNVSAAGQAITTYIRNHLQRCELQEDHPLLLRHVLSGTPSDDDLVPALHSRVGGAHCVLNPNDKRITNFRRGTMVWYMSKAAGVPCPFSRAGIRLCEYGENGKKGTEVNPGKERKRERDRMRRAEQCGQKRKRLLRSCADNKGTDSESSDDEEPQCKKPLTLRLPPLLSRSETRSPSCSVSSPEVIDLSKSDDEDDDDSDSSDDSMSEDSESSSEEEEEDAEEQVEKTEPSDAARLPPYARPSISIPAYTPSDGPYPLLPACSASDETPDRSWRSPSVPYSLASPPPDSDDEDFDMSFGSDPSHPDSTDDMFAEFEFGAETDTQWDSPGPVSPPAQFHDEDIIVKQEPRDVQGLLDAWDDMDNSLTHYKVVNIVAQAAAAGLERDTFKPKEEEFEFDELWREITRPGFDEFLDSPGDERSAFVKQEADEDALSSADRFSTSPSLSPMTPFTPFTPSTSYFRDVEVDIRRNSDSDWADAEIFSPDNIKAHDFDNGVWQDGGIKRDRPLEESVPSSSTSSSPPAVVREASPAISLAKILIRSSDSPAGAPAVNHDTPSTSSSSSSPPLLQSPATILADGPCTSPLSRHASEASEQSSQGSDKDEVVVVDTLTPCVPAIWATTFENISVYQMVLGSYHIFRRMDTDFANVTPMLQFLGLPPPDPETLLSAVVISKGDPLICGTWVDLATARRLVRDEPLLKVFLSDELPEKFPKPMQDFHREKPGRSLRQFGPHFNSTLYATTDADTKRENDHSFRVELPPRARRWAVEDHLLSVHPPFALRSAAMVSAKSDDVMAAETPLSPTEEEIFHTLCGASDWDASPSPTITAACIETKEPAVAPAPTMAAAPLPVSEPDSEPASPPAPEPVPAPIEPPVTRERDRERERPLRRSKRVANAAVMRSRTRSAKRGSRTLS